MMRVAVVAALAALSSYQSGLVRADDGQVCSNGVDGIMSSNSKACCPSACTQCGDTGCGSAGDDCCISDIQEYCSQKKEAPCLIDGVCSNGIAGIMSSSGGACCPSDCTQCGDTGCGSAGTDCCINDIEKYCSKANEAPCLIDNAPSSSDPSPSPPSPTPSSNNSPTSVPTIPTTCDLSTSAFSFSSDEGTKGRYYADGGCFTLTDLYNYQNNTGPLYVLDGDNNVLNDTEVGITGKWLLAADLYVIGEGTFYCRGSDLDGSDCDELRIESTGSDNFHEIRGYGGNLYFESTIVTSWDTLNKRPQEDQDTEGSSPRSFIRCISEVLDNETCDGNAQKNMGECRMDIINSEMGYMGYKAAESYGLSWKVRGFCNNLSNLYLFDNVNVYGDIKGSDIHHMYYGHYSYGLQGGVWTNNLMHDNIQYGFDPHDDSDNLTISGNTVYNNGNHGIIASKRCNNVKIFNNTVSNGGENAHGIMLHRSSDYGEIYNNTITNMKGGSGIALMESSNISVHENTVSGAKIGIRLSLGSSDNEVYDNVIDNTTYAGIYTFTGDDASDVGDGRLRNNEFTDNHVSNTNRSAYLKECDGTLVTDNTFDGAETIEFVDAKDTTWIDNTLSSNDTCLDSEDSTFADSSNGLPAVC